MNLRVRENIHIPLRFSESAKCNLEFSFVLLGHGQEVATGGQVLVLGKV